MYMTLGLIPKSLFWNNGTDPNVTFGLCHLTSKNSFALQFLGIIKCVNSYTTMPVAYNDDLYTSIKEANVVV